MSNFLFGFVKTGKMFGSVCYVIEQNGLANCRLCISFALILAYTRSSIDAQAKQVWIFAYRIKTRGSGHAMPISDVCMIICLSD